MQYALIFRETDHEFQRRDDPGAHQPYWSAWSAYLGALRESGTLVGGNGLQGPQTATTVRIRNGERQVQDGPYAESKEQLGGFVIIEAPDLDTALEWAARSPSASVASTEVRPVLPPMNPQD